jgi:D-alanine transaminase
LAAESGYTLEERSFTIQEALDAKEAFITSATSFVTAVVEIDGTTIGEGVIGPVSKRLREIYIEKAVAAAK